MLGLSSGITSVSAPSSRVLLNTYTSDFTSDADGWVDYAGNDASNTFTANQSIGGQDNCLKVIVETDETGIWGFSKSGAGGVFTADFSPGDYVHVTFKIYLDTTGGAWGTAGAGANFPIYMNMGGGNYDNISMAQNTWVDWDSQALPVGNLDADIAGTSGGNVNIYSTSSQRPQEHAAVFIKNIVIKQYRSALFT